MRFCGVAALPLVMALLLTSCSGPSFDGAVYRGDGFAFRISPVPPSWQRVDDGNSALAFRDEQLNASIMLNGICGKDRDDVPLESLTQHLFLLFTERQIESQEKVGLAGREALRTVLSAKLDGVPMRYESWVLKKDSCVYDMLYFAPHASFASGQAMFRQLVASFATMGPDDD